MKFLSVGYFGDKNEALKYWEDHLKYDLKVEKTRKLLITDPSRIFGVGVISELDKLDLWKNNWENYFPIKSFRIKKNILTNSIFHFDGYFFSYSFISFLYELFRDKKDFFEFKLICNEKKIVVLCLKWYNEYCLACAEIKKQPFIFEKGGVTYISKELNDDNKWIEKERIFSKGNKGLYEFKVRFLNREWSNYLIDKEYLFEKLEEEGDFLDV